MFQPEVLALNDAVQAITPDIAKSRISEGQLVDAGIYPGGWEEEEAIGYLVDIFVIFQAFYQTATDNNEGIITFVS